jgi:hypothetical protein
VAERQPLTLHPNLPAAPRPSATLPELAKWAGDTRAVISDLFTRILRPLQQGKLEIDRLTIPGSGGAKTLILTDEVYGAKLTATGTYASGSGLALLAPGPDTGLAGIEGGKVPIVIGPMGTMGRGSYSDNSLMLFTSVIFGTPNVADRTGWSISSLVQKGTGTFTGVALPALTFSPSSSTGATFVGVNIGMTITNSNATGTFSLYRGRFTSLSGVATRGAIKLLDLLGGTSVGVTIPANNIFPVYVCAELPAPGIINASVTITDLSLVRFVMPASVNATNTIPEANCLKQGVAAGVTTAWPLNISGPKRFIKCNNSIETTANDIVCSAGAGNKGLVVLDTADGNYYRLNTTAGLLVIANLGPAGNPVT